MDVREAYENTVHCYRLSMRMLKLATYIVLSVGVLVTALISKGALLLMTNSVAKVQEVIMIVRFLVITINSFDCFRHPIANVGCGCY